MVQTHNGVLGIKKKIKVLNYVTMWMNLKNMLNVRRQSQESTSDRTPRIWTNQHRQIQSWNINSWWLGQGTMEGNCFMSVGFLSAVIQVSGN